MTGLDEVDEVEGLHPNETVCGVCNLARWRPAGPCPTCAMERPLSPSAVVKGR